MPAASLLTLIDKIAATLDDVAVMTKIAAKKTAGVLGDDLALNAQQVSGVNADRELPVVFAVAKGSAINKLILVPLALAASAFLPWLITPLLMLGGAYLCFEGVEKVVHWFSLHKSKQITRLQKKNVHRENEQKQSEQAKIKGAIRTDFILSAEIIVIALGTVQQASFLEQAIVVSLIAAVMTIGVYGLVAGIVKLDDAGLYLIKNAKLTNQLTTKTLWNRFKEKLGYGLLSFAPKLMKSLTVIGTLAMFLVGGSILFHGVPALHHVQELLEQMIQPTSLAIIVKPIIPFVLQMIIGFLTGVIALILVQIIKFIKSKS